MRLLGTCPGHPRPGKHMRREHNLRIWNKPSSTKITELKGLARIRLPFSPSISPNLKRRPKLNAGEAGCGVLLGAGQSGPTWTAPPLWGATGSWEQA